MAEDIINYIKEKLAKGVSQDQIRQTLLSSGWLPQDIDAAFLQLQVPQSPNPPVSTIQTQPSSPSVNVHKSFLNPKILIATIVVILLISAGAGSYFFFFKEKSSPKENQQATTSETQKQTGLNRDQRSNSQIKQTQPQVVLPATWSECEVFPNESDYVPERIFIEGKLGEDFVADSREEYQPQGFLGKYVRVATEESLKVLKPEDFGPQFSVVVKKRSAGEDGDIDKIWQAWNEQYSQLGSKLVKKNYFGNEASIVSGDSGEGLTTLIYSIIPSHDIFIQINAKGEETKAETYYQEWLSNICQKNE